MLKFLKEMFFNVPATTEEFHEQLRATPSVRVVEPFDDLHRRGRLDLEIEGDRLHLQKYLTFRDKASYLQWRKEWKLEFEAVAACVRAARERMHKPGGDSAAQSQRAALRIQGYNLMLLRKQSKVTAQVQYEARSS